jgi:hypothetical protein
MQLYRQSMWRLEEGSDLIKFLREFFYIEFSIKVQICQMAARITRDNFFFFDSCENSTVKVKKQNLISDRPEYGNT